MSPYIENSYNMAWKDKMAMLDDPNRKPSIVLLGGSNVAFGFQSQMIVDSIGMPVINTGLNAGFGLKFMLSECLPRLRHDDVLVVSNETSYHFYDNGYYGEEAFALLFYQGLVPWNEISARQLRSILEQTPLFLMPKILTTNLTGNLQNDNKAYQRDRFNQFGDYIWHWTNDSLRHLDVVRPFNDDGADFNEEAFNDVVQRLNELKQHGIKVVMFSPAAHRIATKNYHHRFATVAKRFAEVGYQFPDSLGVDLMENDCTYNTYFHLNKKGSAIHTRHLIAWLKQQGIGPDVK
jgi:hypothetical protein